MNVPVTVGYDISKKKKTQVEKYSGDIFIHSGNWWNIDPEKRTWEIVLQNQLEINNDHVKGIMSTNVQTGNDPEYWIKNEDDEAHMEACLENANLAREELESQGIKIPLYCTLQPTNVSMAEKWFQKALRAGHNNLCMGVSEFVRNPKYRKEGKKRILEITALVGKLIEQKRGKFHLSGLMSYHLLPVVAALGATSTDGSTPVQSALAYGTVYMPSGKGMQANKLIEKQDELDWNCGCSFCQDKTKAEIFQGLQDRITRVQHNLILWETLVNTISNKIVSNPIKWYNNNKENLSRTSSRAWDIALPFIDKN